MIAAITATDGRPEAFGLLTRWMAAQDYRGDLIWVVAGSDHAGYDLAAADAMCESRGWLFVSNSSVESSHRDAMVQNLTWAIPVAASGDRCPCVFLEDDDWYAPGYLTAYAEALRLHPLVGAPNARYYNVRTRRFRVLPNHDHASLAQTGVSREAVFHAYERVVLHSRALQLDRSIWSSWKGPKSLDRSLSPLHVSIKGLPGRKGYGIGHRDTFGIPDEGLETFRAWGLPDEYLKYGEPA